jgi:hypothetical protein
VTVIASLWYNWASGAGIYSAYTPKGGDD